MIHKTPILVPDATYHVYNRANGSERIFKTSENYRFFLMKYQMYVSPIAETFCYCLMPNHFHFLIRIRNEEALRQAFPKFETLEKLLSKQFSNLFSSYTQAFNKQQKRKGSLFMKRFKRRKVSDSNYLYNLIRYIHYNPLQSGLSADITGWPHSSYNSILKKDNTFLNATEIIEWYYDLENFKLIHSNDIGTEAIDFENFTHP